MMEVLHMRLLPAWIVIGTLCFAQGLQQEAPKHLTRSLGAGARLYPELHEQDSKAVREETWPKPPPPEPLSPETLNAAIQRGITYLIQAQNPDGSWGGHELRGGVEIYAPVPGAHQAFRAAVTALCISALLETGDKSEAVQQCLARAEDWLMQNLPKVRRANGDAIYNVWTHGYGIQALVRMHKRRPDDVPRRRRIEDLIRQQMNMLERYESVDGGWGYYDFRASAQKPGSDSTSFTTAAILVGLYEAKQIGIDPPEKLVRRAIDSLVRQRLKDFSYLYGEYLKWSPVHPINRPGGSLGRSQCCNAALRMWGDAKITDEVLIIWLDRLIARNGWLDMGRKTVYPHESFFAVAGYFFYFGHYYAGLCIEMLPPDKRPFYQDHLAHIIIRLQEKDGSWFDYLLYDYHKAYGTAFALMTLQRCKRAEENPQQK